MDELVKAMPIHRALWRTAEAHVLSRISFCRPILDLGCGDGIFASILFANTVDVGVDIDFRQISLALSAGAYHTLLVGEASELPFPASFFGSVLSNCVIEHIPEVEKVLDEVHRVLVRDGYFVFTVPSEYFGDSLLYPAWLDRVGLRGLAEIYRTRANQYLQHYHCDSPVAWQKRLEQAGFTLAAQQYIVPRQISHLWDLLAPIGRVQMYRPSMITRWSYLLVRAILSLLRRPVLAHLKRTDGIGAGLVIVAQKRQHHGSDVGHAE